MSQQTQTQPEFHFVLGYFSKEIVHLPHVGSRDPVSPQLLWWRSVELIPRSDAARNVWWISFGVAFSTTTITSLLSGDPYDFDLTWGKIDNGCCTEIRHSPPHRSTRPWLDSKLHVPLRCANMMWWQKIPQFDRDNCRCLRNLCTALKQANRPSFGKYLTASSVGATKRFFVYLRRRTRAKSSIPALMEKGSLADADYFGADILTRRQDSVYSVTRDPSQLPRVFTLEISGRGGCYDSAYYGIQLIFRPGSFGPVYSRS